jgi:hypothetical protein
MRRVAIPVTLFVFAAVGWALLSANFDRALARHWSFTKSVVIDRGTYFRLKVKLTYKGKPQDFDFVVGCNVRQTNYQDNSRSVDLGMVPEVFGRRTSDGKAVVIRPPRACRGETTANGGAPPDLLPMVIVYDNAHNLAFGTAYMSEDAYESPLSELTFGGATIEKATRVEFDHSRETQSNVLTHEMYWRLTAEGRKQPNANNIPQWGVYCRGFARYRLPNEFQQLVRKYWPKSKPRYWQPDRGTLQTIWSELRAAKAIRSDEAAAPIHTYVVFANALAVTEKGLTTRIGGGRLDARSVLFPPAVYPDADAWGPPPWPLDPIAAARKLVEARRRASASVGFRDGAERGFAYCYTPVNLLAPSWRIYMSKPGENRVDDIEIYHTGPLDTPILFVERDEFIFDRFEIGLFTGMGDA